jgi:mRNA-capping enzyme
MSHYERNGRTGHSGPGPIPKRWLNCPRKSAALINNKFVAFKTPLDAKFNDQVPPGSTFTPEMLLDSMKSMKVSTCVERDEEKNCDVAWNF